jgi:glycine oxidase
MVRLRPADPVPWTLVADHAGHYVVPRANGTVLVGSTMEDAGFDATVTAQARGGLVAAGRALIPDLGGAEIVEHWCGFRPISADNAPILGPDPDLGGLFYATGTGRRGILLAPLVGRIVAELATTGATDGEWTDFSVTRFDAPSPV